MPEKNRWLVVESKIKGVADGLGRGLDDEIVEVVTGLNALNIRTSASCGGREAHSDHGTDEAWVELGLPQVGRIAMDIHLGELRRITQDGYSGHLSPRSKLIFEATNPLIVMAEERVARRAIPVVYEFNGSNGAKGGVLAIKEEAFGSVRITGELPVMQRFGGFLKRKFFGEE